MSTGDNHKPVFRLESDGKFHHSNLVLISTGEQLPASRVGWSLGPEGIRVTLEFPPGVVAIDVQTDKAEKP